MKKNRYGQMDGRTYGQTQPPGGQPQKLVFRIIQLVCLVVVVIMMGPLIRAPPPPPARPRAPGHRGQPGNLRQARTSTGLQYTNGMVENVQQASQSRY